MRARNRRKSDRLRIDRAVRINIQIFPVMPFLGESIEAALINISPGGVALAVTDRRHEEQLKRGVALRVHVRLPGLTIEECKGVVTHSYLNRSHHVIGVKFTKVPAPFLAELRQMSNDNASCDTRIASGDNAWCLPTCSFYSLCRKPIRLEDHHGLAPDPLEISFQYAE